MRGPADEGYLQAFEGILLAFLAVAAVAYVAGLERPGEDGARGAAAADELVRDTLLILGTLPADPPYESRLHQYVTDAIRGDTSNLSGYVGRMMPPGAEWGVYLDNGEGVETLYETGTPSGEVHSESVLFYPDWNYQMVFALLDRQAGTTTLQGMPVKVVPVKHSYMDRTAAGNVVFSNGRSFPTTQQADFSLLTGSVVPEYVAAPDGYDVPYDTSSLLAHTASVATQTPLAPVAFNATTTLPLPVVRPGGDPTYRVHPTYVVDAALQSFLQAQPRVSADNGGKVRPGGTATVTYDYSGLPLAAGWSVSSREIHVYGPVLGTEVTSATLPALTGQWAWPVPRDALYGTYVVELRLGLVKGGLVQTVHDVTAFDVLRKGVDAPVPPLYRAVLAIWFPGL